MTLFLLLAALVVLAVVVPRWGTDSRDGQDWKPWEPRRECGSCKAV